MGYLLHISLIVSGVIGFGGLSANASDDCQTELKQHHRYDDLSKVLTCLQRRIAALEKQLQVQETSDATGSAYGFRAGTYEGFGDGVLYELSGPTKVGNREGWSLRNSDGTFNVRWYTGPPEKHPVDIPASWVSKLVDGIHYGRIGTVDKNSHKGIYRYWRTGKLMSGASSASGKGLTVTNYKGTTPSDSFTLTLRE